MVISDAVKHKAPLNCFYFIAGRSVGKIYSRKLNQERMEGKEAINDGDNKRSIGKSYQQRPQQQQQQPQQRYHSISDAHKTLTGLLAKYLMTGSRSAMIGAFLKDVPSGVPLDTHIEHNNNNHNINSKNSKDNYNSPQYNDKGNVDDTSSSSSLLAKLTAGNGIDQLYRQPKDRVLSRSRRSGTIVEECCLSPCSFAVLLTYCATNPDGNSTRYSIVSITFTLHLIHAQNQKLTFKKNLL